MRWRPFSDPIAEVASFIISISHIFPRLAQKLVSTNSWGVKPPK